MNRELNEIIDSRKTIMLPNNTGSNCYAIYSKEEYENVDEKLLVDGKAYKHRLYFFKKIEGSTSDKILTFIFLNPGWSNHIKQDSEIENCINIANQNEYGTIEIFSLFTLRTLDTIDSVSEDAILNVVRADLSKNDVVLAFGDEIKPTEKYPNISKENLDKINKVREIKINELIKFITKQEHSRVIYTLENNCLKKFK